MSTKLNAATRLMAALNDPIGPEAALMNKILKLVKVRVTDNQLKANKFVLTNAQDMKLVAKLVQTYGAPEVKQVGDIVHRKWKALGHTLCLETDTYSTKPTLIYVSK